MDIVVYRDLAKVELKVAGHHLQLLLGVFSLLQQFEDIRRCRATQHTCSIHALLPTDTVVHCLLTDTLILGYLLVHRLL